MKSIMFGWKLTIAALLLVSLWLLFYSLFNMLVIYPRCGG